MKNRRSLSVAGHEGDLLESEGEGAVDESMGVVERGKPISNFSTYFKNNMDHDKSDTDPDYPRPDFDIESEEERWNQPEPYHFTRKRSLEDVKPIYNNLQALREGDVVDFQSGLPEQTVTEIVDEFDSDSSFFTIHFCEDFNNPWEMSYGGESTNSYIVTHLAIDRTHASIFTDHYHGWFSLMYGEITGVEVTEEASGTQRAVLDWRLIPEGISPSVRHPDLQTFPHALSLSRENISEKVRKMRRAYENEGEKWYKTVTEDYAPDVEPGIEEPMLLKPLLGRDGRVSLQDIRRGVEVAETDYTTFYPELSESDLAFIDVDIRRKLAADNRFPFEYISRDDVLLKQTSSTQSDSE